MTTKLCLVPDILSNQTLKLIKKQSFDCFFILLTITIDHRTGPEYDEFENCTHNRGDNYNIACPGDAEDPTPMSVTKAALACNCNNTNTCSVGLAFQ